jgi:predicted nuclease with TOPRIM domain
MSDFSRLRLMNGHLQDLKRDLAESYKRKTEIFESIETLEDSIRAIRAEIRNLLNDKWRASNEVSKKTDERID